MASINVRKETGKLFITFHLNAKRCREQTSLSDTKANRKRLEKIAEKIQSEIDSGTFNYATYFPNSKALKQLQPVGTAASAVFTQQPLGTPLRTDTPIFSDYVDSWKELNQPLWRESYRKSIESSLRAHLLPWFGEKRVSDIVKLDILEFRAHLAKAKSERKRVRSPRTINRNLKLLRSILSEAADQYEFKSPFIGVKLLKEQKHHIEPLSLAEVQQLLKNVREDYRNYFQIRFFTGMRSGEMHGLRWENVDFERNEILVRETYADKRVEYTKNDGSQREIYLSAPVKSALHAQYQITGEQNYVFCTANGQPLDTPNVYNRVWLPLLRLLGYKKRRLYETRHTCATLWLAAGESPEWIARQLGHVDTTMLFKTYSRYVPNMTRQDGSAMDRLLETLGGPRC